MRCRTCDYQLWNLATRRCPECGTPFEPSDFAFAPRSVVFCCPHCQHEHIGDGPDGRPVESALNCAGCGQPINVDDMILRPAPGFTEEQTHPELLPWLQRDRHGFWRAWLQTVRLAMFHPAEMMKLTPPSSSFWSAVSFFLINQAIVALPISFFVTGMLLWWADAFGRFARGGMDMSMVLAVSYFLGTIAAALSIAILARVIGKHPKDDSDLQRSRTLQAVLYSGGTSLILAIPLVGLVIGIPWWFFSTVAAMRAAHPSNTGRAVYGVLAGVAIVVTPLIISFALPTSSCGRSLSGLKYEHVYEMFRVLRDYSDDHNGENPPHASALINDGRIIRPGIFLDPRTNTKANDLVIDGRTIRVSSTQPHYILVSEDDERAQAQPGTVAHRFGDSVFCYHGINLQDLDRSHGLWILVSSPDPDANPTLPSKSAFVAFAGGRVERIKADRFADALAEQNALRVERGFAPLPDPSTITRDKPAVAPVPQSQPAAVGE
jgi:hypothetical protein